MSLQFILILLQCWNFKHFISRMFSVVMQYVIMQLIGFIRQFITAECSLRSMNGNKIPCKKMFNLIDQIIQKEVP